jgi:glutaredoxin-dependent peroxiredoxin
VYGISVDSTWVHQAWRIVSGFPDELVLLSDFNRDFGEAYGLTYASSSGFRGVLRRTAFVIDRDGTITYRWDVPDPPALPQVDEVLAALRGLKPRTQPSA